MGNAYERVRKQIVGWWEENGLACLAVFALSILVYFPYLSDVLSNPDGVAWWDNPETPLWILGQGRWGLYISDYLKPPINLSPISTIWSLALYSLGGMLFSCLLENKTLTTKVITGASIVCYPMVACTNTYWSCGFAIAFLLAMISVAVTVKAKNKLVGILAGSVLLSVAVGNHQGQLSTAAGAGLMYLIALLAREPEKFREWLVKARDILLMGLTGTTLYYIILQAMLQKYGMTLESYGGGDKITPRYIFTSLPTTIKNCYINFKNFFFSQNIMVNSYQVKPLYIFFFALFAITLCLGIYRLRKKPLPCVALVGCTILIPLFCSIVNLCTPDNPGVALHMTGGLCLFVPFIFSMFIYELQSILGAKGALLRDVSILLALALIWNFVLIDYADAGLMLRTKDLTAAMANRAYCQIEMDERYSSGMKVLMIGRPDCSDYIGNGINYYDRTNGYARWGMMWAGEYNSLNGWSTILNHYVDGNIVTADWNDVDRIVAMEEFENMPIYPTEGCIKMAETK